MIYRNFEHWYSTSETHGFSSASRDFARALWNDLAPTMEANRDDATKAYIELSKEVAKDRSELVDALLAYIEIHKTPGQTGFWRWWLDMKTPCGPCHDRCPHRSEEEPEEDPNRVPLDEILAVEKEREGE